MRVEFSGFARHVFSFTIFLVLQISQKLEIAGSLGSELKLPINKKNHALMRIDQVYDQLHLKVH